MATTNIAPPVTGQDINFAALATRRALEVLLAEQGTSFEPTATMNAIAGVGKSPDLDGQVRFLSSALRVDVQTVETILHGLEARGLVQQTASDGDGKRRYALTPEGEAEQRRLNEVTAALAARLYRDFDPDDLAITRRVLVTLTERATAHVASVLA